MLGRLGDPVVRVNAGERDPGAPVTLIKYGAAVVIILRAAYTAAFDVKLTLSGLWRRRWVRHYHSFVSAFS